MTLMSACLALLLACSPDVNNRKQTGSVGEPVTFTKHIAPIIFEQCARCHRPDGSAPFSLLTYEDVRARARQIRDVTTRRFMPPWLPEPGFGDFMGERRLGNEQIDLIASWVEQGVAEGAPGDMPARPTWAGGWQLGEPDLVVELPEAYILPAEGVDVFRNFVIPVPVSGRRYVRAVEFRPDNPRVVHHLTLGIDRTRASRRRDEQDAAPGFEGMLAEAVHSPDGHFLGWTPGKVPLPGSDDRAWRLDRGTDLVLQLHMLPTGKPEPIQVRIGFFFAARSPTRTPAMVRLGSKTIDMPAGRKDYTITDTFVLPVAVDVLSVYPHAHYVARQMKGWATLPDGSTKWLISINEWDFNWQDEYRYATPMFLPAKTRLTMEFVYDNSADNPRNPHDPPRRVIYGPQSSDEMGDLWLQVLPRRNEDLPVLMQMYIQRELAAELASAEKMIQIDPDDPVKRNFLATRYLRAGRIEETIAQLKEALRLDRRYADAYNNLGLALGSKGDMRGAIGQFQEALRRKPQSADVHFNLGNALKAVGQTGEAMAHFRQAVGIDSDYADAHNNLGVELGALGRLDEAVDHFRQVLSIDSDRADAHNNLGVALWAQGKLVEARSQFEEALALDPGYADARDNLALVTKALSELR